MIKVLNESGFNEAMLGLGLSYNVISLEDYKNRNFDKVYDTALKLCGKGGGHDKFLESMNVTLYVEAPRYIWQEFDTYRVGITKQSESTMHTLKKANIDTKMFEELELEENMFDFHLMISYMRKILKRGNLHDIKVALPEGFIQTRVVATNYKAIRNIYYQRINHRMKWWKTNLTDMLTQLAYPEFIEKK